MGSSMVSFCQASCNIVLLNGHESVFSYSYEGLKLHPKGKLHFTESVQHQECVSAQLPTMVKKSTRALCLGLGACLDCGPTSSLR